MKGTDSTALTGEVGVCQCLSVRTAAMAPVGKCRVLVVLWILLGVTTSVSDAANSYVWADTKVATTSDITCWTCNDKANNEDCNDWAPDLKCPLNHTVCQTVHRFAGPKRTSVRVTKSCVQATQCTPKHVGCSQPDSKGQQECTSCCDYSYCNQEVPVNRSSALKLSAFTVASASGSAALTLRPSCLLLLAAVLMASLRAFPSSRHGHRLWTLAEWTWRLRSWPVQ